MHSSVSPWIQNFSRYFDIALVARGGLGTGVVACLSKMISSWIHATSANHIHYNHRRLHRQVSLPEPQLWLNLAILPKLHSNSESSLEFACTLQNHPCQSIINHFCRTSVVRPMCWPISGNFSGLNKGKMHPLLGWPAEEIVTCLYMRQHASC